MTGADAVDPPVRAPASTLVVLVVAGEGQHNPDSGLLHDTVRRAGHAVRVLMLVTDDTGLALAEGLAATQVELQLLLGPDVSDPGPARNFARMPHGTRPNDQLDFALALADVVIADPARHDDSLVHRARALGKRLVAPGHGLPGLPPINNVAEGLDPLALPRHGWRRHWAGRVEQTLVELLGLFAA